MLADAQLEYIGADGRSGRVNIDVASRHYCTASIRAKAYASFVLHTTDAAQARVFRLSVYFDGLPDVFTSC